MLINNNSKYTIAYLTRSIETLVGISIWEGIIASSKKHNFNLLTFYGEQLGSSDANIIYELVNKKLLKGIISWVSSDINEYVNFFERFKDIPLVSLTLHLKGHPVICIDSYSGMKEEVNHLIKDHGYAKLGFIRGPEKHVYAQERYQAYIDALEENRILYDERLVTPYGSWLAKTGVDGVKKLLEERKLIPKKDIDAIVGVSDAVMVGVLEELDRRNIKVPDEIALASNNYTAEAVSAKPALTSVALPFFEQGEISVKVLADMINNKEVPEKISLPSKMKILMSCGCQYLTVQNAAVRSEISKVSTGILDCLKIKIKDLRKQKKEYHREFFEGLKKGLLPEMTQIVIKYLETSVISKEAVEEYIKKFLNAFFAEIQDEKQESFIDILNSILYDLLLSNANVDVWHGVITVLRRSIIPYLSNIDLSMHVADLLDQARVLISEVIKQSYQNKILISDKRLTILREFGSALLNSLNIDSFINTFETYLLKLDIQGCYLSLFENPGEYKFPYKAPEWSNLIFAFNKQKEIMLKEQDKRYLTENILPENVLSNLNNYNFFLIPLFYKNLQLGFLIIDNGPIDINMYGLLRDQISSRLYTLKLFEELTKTKDNLQDTLNSLQNKVSIISSNSEQISNMVKDISASMEEVAQNIKEISKNINEVMIIVIKAVNMGNNTRDIIKELSNHSEKIGNITEFINDIAQQTNILSLNASIEAARAGTSGKGFSIVAREVKGLANKTVKSTGEISQMVKMMQESTKETISSIIKVIDIIKEISILSNTITNAITQQATVTNQISTLLSEAAHDTKEITEAITEVSNLSMKISEQKKE